MMILWTMLGEVLMIYLKILFMENSFSKLKKKIEKYFY